MITKTTSQKIIAFVLIASAVGSSFIPALAPRAEAQLTDLISDAASCYLGNSIGDILTGLFESSVGFNDTSGAEVPVADDDLQSAAYTMQSKEFGLDCLVWAATKAVLDSVTESVLGWAQSGNWNGTPFFVEDPSQYFASLEDDVNNLFIDELADAGTNISPNFKSSLIQAVQLDSVRIPYQESRSSQCAVDTTDAFIEDFSGQGGWDTFLTVVSNPQNTPFGCYSIATAELNRRQSVVAQEQRDFLNWGEGFLPELNPRTGSVLTPGSLIRDQLTKVISSGLEELQNADELAEILTALATSLISTIFGGGGLLNAN